MALLRHSPPRNRPRAVIRPSGPDGGTMFAIRGPPGATAMVNLPNGW